MVNVHRDKLTRQSHSLTIWIRGGIYWLCLISCLTLSAETPIEAEKQKQEWEKLYPKLNSKMARMEEILNFVDRFIGDASFKDAMLEKLVEFQFLTIASIQNTPDYLNEEERTQFIQNLKKTNEFGRLIRKSIMDENDEKAKEIFLRLDAIRRKSHANWVY